MTRSITLLVFLLALLLAACPPADTDGDGSPDDEDCAPTDPDIHPTAPDPWGDGVDSNCDGADGTDADGDGWPVDSAPELSPPDCDDTDPEIWPGRPWDSPTDEVDTDCDGRDWSGLPGAAGAIVMGGYGELGRNAIVGGDVDGDGLADLVVSDHRWEWNSGKVEVYPGATLRAGGTFDWKDAAHTVYGDSPQLQVGFDLAVPGDVDGDGLDDIAIAAPGAWELPGRVHLVLAEQLQAQGDVLVSETITIASDEDEFGQFVAGGDIDGDDRADLLVGPPGLVFFSDALLAESYLTVRDADYHVGGGELTGLVVTDFDGDSLDDLVLTNVGMPCMGMEKGGVQVELAATLDDSGPTGCGADLLMPYGYEFWHVGQFTDVAALQDLDGDGRNEVAATIQNENTDPPTPVIVQVVPGRSGAAGPVLLRSQGISLQREPDVASFGRRLAAGDLDGDGLADLVVGSLADLPDSSVGAVYVYSGLDLAGGLDSGDAPRPGAMIGAQDPPYPLLPGDTAVLGDVDGDGLDDLALGGDINGRGVVYIVFGAPGL